MNKKDLILGLQTQIKSEEAAKAILTANIDKKIRTYQETIACLEREDEEAGVSIGLNGLKGTKGTNMTMIDTVKHVIYNDIIKFESADTVAHIVSNYHPKKKFEHIRVAVSGILSHWRRSGEIAKYQYSKANMDTVWGRKEWLNEVGQPKMGFFVNPKAIVPGPVNSPPMIIEFTA